MQKALNAAEAVQSSVQVIDCTMVRAHQHGIGRKMEAHQENIGRSFDGQTTKIHLRTNSVGLPIAVTLAGGEATDYKGYQTVMQSLGLSRRS